VCSVMVGTNRITNCQTLISVKDHSLLRVTLSPLRVSLRLPRDLPSRVFFEIVENEIKAEGITANPDLRLVSGETNVSIFWKDMLLL